MTAVSNNYVQAGMQVQQPKDNKTNTDKKVESKNKEMSTATKVGLGAIALSAIVIGGLLTKGKLWGKAQNVTKRTLADGKEVVKKVIKNKDGSKTTIMEVFENGKVIKTRKKTVSRAINPANGKKYINIKKVDDYSGEFVDEISTNKYYSQEGKKLLSVEHVKTHVDNEFISNAKDIIKDNNISSINYNEKGIRESKIYNDGIKKEVSYDAKGLPLAEGE